MELQYEIKFKNRMGKTETITANTERKAIAIGKAWAQRETFKLYFDGILIDIYEHGKRVELTIK